MQYRISPFFFRTNITGELHELLDFLITLFCNIFVISSLLISFSFYDIWYAPCLTDFSFPVSMLCLIIFVRPNSFLSFVNMSLYSSISSLNSFCCSFVNSLISYIWFRLVSDLSCYIFMINFLWSSCSSQ